MSVVQLVVRGMAGAAAAGGDDPYKVLQVTPETESDRVMFAYNKLVRPSSYTGLATTRPALDTSRGIPPASHRKPHVMIFAAWYAAAQGMLTPLAANASQLPRCSLAPPTSHCVRTCGWKAPTLPCATPSPYQLHAAAANRRVVLAVVADGGAVVAPLRRPPHRPCSSMTTLS